MKYGRNCRQLLKSKGITDYSIFLDPDTNSLFGVLKVADQEDIG